jgi:hypothetical protein
MQHRAFSPRRIGAIAGNTFTELTRLKVFYFLLLFGFLLIGSSVFLARLTFQQEFQVLKDVSLGAVSIFTSLLAILATARLLAEDIEHKVVYTILAKPVPRFEYIIGKLAGVLLLLAISTAMMSALFFGLLYLREQSALTEMARQMAGAPAEQVSDALRELRTSIFTPNLLPAIGAIFLKGCILAALTLFVSTFATSNIFTILVTLFVYFIGHLQSPAREFWLHEHGAGWSARTFLACVALLFPDLQLFDFSVASDQAIPPALLLETAALGLFYIVLYLLLAIAVFTGKEL